MHRSRWRRFAWSALAIPACALISGPSSAQSHPQSGAQSAAQSAAQSNAQSDAHPDAQHKPASKNFFLEPHSSAQPSFNGTQLSESERENRLIPDIRLLRTLPGLDPEARKQINRLYKDWQNETAELRSHNQVVSRQIGKLNEVASAIPKDKSEKAEKIDEMSDTKTSDSQNIPTKSIRVEDEAVSGKSLADLKREQKDGRLEMLSKRKELWEKIRPLLSEQNQQDLEKMRRGEFMPATATGANEVKAGEGGK